MNTETSPARRVVESWRVIADFLRRVSEDEEEKDLHETPDGEDES